jgi:hypothetical protein
MKRILLIACIAMCVFCAAAQAAQVTLAWDANNPAPTGYRLYQKVAGAEYDYSRPAWQGPGTSCTVTVPDGVESYFVVRAYVQGSAQTQESGNSNEVFHLTSPPAPKNLLLQAIDQLILGMQTMKQWADSQQ